MRSRCARVVLAAGLVFGPAAAGDAHAQLGLGQQAFHADYKMMVDPEDLKKHESCSRFAAIEVDAAPAEMTRVGSRRWEPGEGPEGEAPILILGDTKEWAKRGAAAILEKAGIAAAAGAPTIVVTVLKLEINEEKAGNSVWKGNVTLGVAVKSPSGEACWRSEYFGTAKNWGDSANLVNYQETINHALDRALADLVKDADFAEALCAKCK